MIRAHSLRNNFAFFAKNFQLPIEIAQNLYYNKKEADAFRRRRGVCPDGGGSVFQSKSFARPSIREYYYEHQER